VPVIEPLKMSVRRDDLVAGGLEGDGKVTDAANQREVRGQDRLDVAAGEMGQVEVAGGGIVKRIQGRDREVEGHTSHGKGRRTDGKVGAAAGLTVTLAPPLIEPVTVVGGRDGLAGGGLERGAESAHPVDQRGVGWQD